MSDVKSEPKSPPKMNGGAVAEEEDGERLELDFVEESTGDDWEGGIEEVERVADKSPPESPRSLSAPKSPDYGDGGEETVVLHAGEEEELEGAEKQKATTKGGPKTPPESDAEHKSSMDASMEDSGDRRRKRQHSSPHSPYSVERAGERDETMSGDSGTPRSQSPPRSYKTSERDRSRGGRAIGERVKRELIDEEEDEERLRQNRRERLVPLRDAGSRRIDHIPASLVTSSGRRRDYAPQPYFKNPSYYPRDKEHPPRATSPPPLVPRLEPLPGGRLPLVQRRSSPAPYESSAPHRRSPAPPLKKRRYIVEEISHVPRRSRTPPPYRDSGRSVRDIGPQTLYPSRRDPYPPPRDYRNGRYYDNGGSDRGTSSGRYSRSSGSERNDQYIFTGSKLIPKPFVPPPPPGKRWNCPQRKETYVPAERSSKWRCPKREPPTPPRR